MNTFELGSQALALTEHYGAELEDMAGATLAGAEPASVIPGQFTTAMGQFGGHSPDSEEHLQESASYSSEEQTPYGQYYDLSSASSNGYSVPPPYLNTASYQNVNELASNTDSTYYEPLNYHKSFYGAASTEMNNYYPPDSTFNYNMAIRNGSNSDYNSGYSGENVCSSSRTSECCTSTPPPPAYFAVNKGSSVSGGVCLRENRLPSSPRNKGRRKGTTTTESSLMDYKSQTSSKFRSNLFSQGSLDMGLQEELKNEWRKHRNRVAALKCRERKLMRLEGLQNKKNDLEMQCDDLANQKFILKSKVLSLARALKAHQAAGCTGLNMPAYVNYLCRLC